MASIYAGISFDKANWIKHSFKQEFVAAALRFRFYNCRFQFEKKGGHFIDAFLQKKNLKRIVKDVINNVPYE